ncbi:hypothetical protein [Methylotuvimicrobium buryatense]|uniref:VWFA domain-containing protein n=1 Tax=Methylotuvimicrobium buryatense TaxID=95641 RepID=A0A4P9UKK5_METBY|nr:hypothetical protein [Methylotuvimicrobium buryatense]QCW81020.1 hypothetical protein EQU24_01190 [Methylotuvimicrobium buryatense]
MSLRRKKKKSETSYIIGGVFLIFVTLIVAGALALYHIENKNIELDNLTLCPSSGPTGHLVILVDKTDPLNFTQKKSFQVLLEEIISNKIGPGELVSVFSLGEDYKSTAEPLISICNPGDARDKSELTSNIKRLVDRYENQFRLPMLQLAKELTSQEPAKLSPILEMIQLVSINGFRASGVDGPRRLILVSDMLHHTPNYSMYKNGYEYKKFLDTDYGRKMNVDLAGVQVELHYVLNTPKYQTRKHLKFWEDYFSNAGAHIVLVRPLEG